MKEEKELKLTNPMVKRILTLTLVEQASCAPGILQPVSTITPENHPGIHMEVHLERNYIHIYYKAEQVGIPFANVKGWKFA